MVSISKNSEIRNVTFLKISQNHNFACATKRTDPFLVWQQVAAGRPPQSPALAWRPLHPVWILPPEPRGCGVGGLTETTLGWAHLHLHNCERSTYLPREVDNTRAENTQCSTFMKNITFFPHYKPRICIICWKLRVAVTALAVHGI